MDAAGKVEPAQPRRLGRVRREAAGRPADRPAASGCEREQRQDIGEDQLLMLLLVVDAELDQLGQGRMRARRAVVEQRVEQRGVDVAAIAQHLRRGVGRVSSPRLRPRLPGARCLVVGIEAVGEAVIERCDSPARCGLQHERLEEPGGVRQVPFGGAGVVHRLDDLVLRAQRLGEREREPARLGGAPRQWRDTRRVA